MTIDPARLARIRARVLAAAATMTVPACGGGVPPHVNERPREHVNVSPPDDPPPKQGDSPIINERPADPPAPPPDNINTPRPEPKHINTPAPNGPVAVAKPLSPKDIPPPGQTINVVQADPDRPPSTINTAVAHPPAPAPAPAKPVPHHVNTPDEKR